jgi:hypothetical protein
MGRRKQGAMIFRDNRWWYPVDNGDDVMPYAKDFPYEYVREFRVDGLRESFRGLALYIDDRNGNLKSQEQRKDQVVAQLRGVGVPVRVVHGVYGSRKYANALRGWMVFIRDRDYDPRATMLINQIEKEDA